MEEKGLLVVRPGITDFSSIIFSDEGDILKDKSDPDLAYNQLIRPWKSRLGLFYIQKHNLLLDVNLILLTLVAIISRERALSRVSCLLEQLGAEDSLARIAMRAEPLVPTPPPGTLDIVTARN
jgi:hypothetical protein